MDAPALFYAPVFLLLINTITSNLGLSSSATFASNVNLDEPIIPTLVQRLPNLLPQLTPNDKGDSHACNKAPLPSDRRLVEDAIVETRNVDGCIECIIISKEGTQGKRGRTQESRHDPTTNSNQKRLVLGQILPDLVRGSRLNIDRSTARLY
jgi:hypothetical protein